jgi:hypothetical protein
MVSLAVSMQGCRRPSKKLAQLKQAKVNLGHWFALVAQMMFFSSFQYIAFYTTLMMLFSLNDQLSKLYCA